MFGAGRVAIACWQIHLPVSTDEDPDPTMLIEFLGDTLWGGYADYCVVWDRQLVRIPESVSTELAACLPVAYGSAYRMVMYHGQIKAGDKVLVLGASGGVGNCAVQLAKSVGCFVVGACGSETRCQQLKEVFGVDEAINTAAEDICRSNAQTDRRVFAARWRLPCCREQPGRGILGEGFTVRESERQNGCERCAGWF